MPELNILVNFVLERQFVPYRHQSFVLTTSIPFKIYALNEVSELARQKGEEPRFGTISLKTKPDETVSGEYVNEINYKSHPKI